MWDWQTRDRDWQEGIKAPQSLEKPQWRTAWYYTPEERALQAAKREAAALENPVKKVKKCFITDYFAPKCPIPSQMRSSS